MAERSLTPLPAAQIWQRAPECSIPHPASQIQNPTPSTLHQSQNPTATRSPAPGSRLWREAASCRIADLTPRDGFLWEKLMLSNLLLRVSFFFCASHLCAFPCLDLRKQEERLSSPQKVSKGWSCPSAASATLQCPCSTLHLSINASSWCFVRPWLWAWPCSASQDFPESHGTQSHRSGRGQTCSMWWEAAVPKGCGMLQPVLMPPSPISPCLVAIIPHSPLWDTISFPSHHSSSRLADVPASPKSLQGGGSDARGPLMPEDLFPGAIQICGAGVFHSCCQVQ